MHCPENLGNNAKRLSDYEKSLGFKSFSISLRKESFGFEADQTLVKSGSFALGELARWKLLLLAISNYDVIHFNNGKTIMPHRIPFESIRKRTNIFTALLYTPYAWLLEGKDIFLLKLMGKRLYFTFQGSDARLSTHYTALHPTKVLAKLNPDYISARADAYKTKRIARAEKHADKIYCLNPDLLRNFSSKAKFRPYYNVDTHEVAPHNIFENDTIHIVHAPSKRDIKGTSYILEAVNNICLTQKNIRFTLVENLSNKDAQKVYDTADLFIDQLIVGWYGGVSVELLARGVPVICFLADTSNLPQAKNLTTTLPIFNSSIDTIQTDLENILKRPKNELKTWGKSGIGFVQQFHSPSKSNRRY